jgi:HAD superfamily hydrolase (TIGR01509 family)
MPSLCVIFDLDGTLVDSEPLCNQAFLDLLPELNESVESLVQRFRGRKLAAILTEIEDRLGKPLPDGFEQRYRRRVAELFDTRLEPTPGAREMLETMCFQKCIASSGPMEKISQALAVSGLAPFFGNNVFSSYVIGSWKPNPGLFLHAAQSMGFAPNHCIVVEDSEVGLHAAAAASMSALHYAPWLTDNVSQSGHSFQHMTQLPHLIEQLAHARQHATPMFPP